VQLGKTAGDSQTGVEMTKEGQLCLHLKQTAQIDFFRISLVRDGGFIHRLFTQRKAFALYSADSNLLDRPCSKPKHEFIYLATPSVWLSNDFS
jgi:hypothetical protein